MRWTPGVASHAFEHIVSGRAHQRCPTNLRDSLRWIESALNRKMAIVTCGFLSFDRKGNRKVFRIVDTLIPLESKVLRIHTSPSLILLSIADYINKFLSLVYIFLLCAEIGNWAHFTDWSNNKVTAYKIYPTNLVNINCFAVVRRNTQHMLKMGKGSVHIVLVE